VRSKVDGGPKEGWKAVLGSSCIFNLNLLNSSNEQWEWLAGTVQNVVLQAL